MEPRGTIAFSTVGVPYYGFDVFSATLPDTPDATVTERRLTDGVSVNFNAQFVAAGEDGSNSGNGAAVVFVSERSGSAKLYLTRPTSGKPPLPLPSIPGSLFHDRPTLRNGTLYFTSAHERPAEPFKSWSAVYSTDLDKKEAARLTPTGTADLSPAVSPSGGLVAVASYGSSSWKGDFHELETEIVVFRASDPGKRAVVAPAPAGWPAWSGESTLFFHRTAEDGWWSIYRVDLIPNGLEATGPPRRVTPPGFHTFTPSASCDGKLLAVATRRKGRKTRQIEIFDLESEKFRPVTEPINPDIHHYNPFFSPDDDAQLGYHRFRGDSAESGDKVIPHLNPVASPIPALRMVRLHNTFPSFSPGGDLVAINGDLERTAGLMVARSDGSRRWTLFKPPAAFHTGWSPAEKGVVYTSVGPIFESSRSTVQIARMKFDLQDLADDREEVAVLTTMLTREDAGNNAFPSCSPDGNWVVFRSGRTGQKNLYVVDAIRGETGGGEIRRLTEGDWIDTMPSWSPRGDLIAFSSNRHRPDDPSVFSIYLVRPDGTGLKRVYIAGPKGSAEADRERVNHVCFSPDGEWMLFAANFGSVTTEPVSQANHFQPYGDLYVCRLDGTGLRRLTFNGYENGTPAWCRTGPEAEIGRLSVAEGVGDRLMGKFDEPLWITCDM